MEQTISFIQASIPGEKPDNIPNQDCIQVFENDSVFICTVSDGLGSSLYSNEGALLACECVINILKNENLEINLEMLSNQILKKWFDRIKQSHGLIKDYRTANSFVSVFKKTKSILVGQLGDVMISLRIDELFRHIETPQKEFCNETVCLGSRDQEPYKIAKFEFVQSFDFFIATDGIADEIEPSQIEAFQNYIKEKFRVLSIVKRNKVLHSEIENFMNDKNNDDKSLVYTWTNK